MFYYSTKNIGYKEVKTGRRKPQTEMGKVTPAQILVSNTIKPLMAALRHQRPGLSF